MTLFPPSRLPVSEISVAEVRSQSFMDYQSHIGTIGDTFRRAHAAVDFTKEEMASIAAIAEPLRIFAIVEESCPDVIANLPIVARITEMNPFLSLFVLSRPDHAAFAAAYPGPDITHSRIPTYVVIDAENRERGVLVERPAAITVLLKPHIEKVHTELETHFPGADSTALPADFVARLMAEGAHHRADLADPERVGVVKWLLRCARPDDRPLAP